LRNKNLFYVYFKENEFQNKHKYHTEAKSIDKDKDENEDIEKNINGIKSDKTNKKNEFTIENINSFSIFIKEKEEISIISKEEKSDNSKKKRL